MSSDAEELVIFHYLTFGSEQVIRNTFLNIQLTPQKKIVLDTMLVMPRNCNLPR